MASTRTTFTLDDDLATRARELNINISAAAPNAVPEAVTKAMTDSDRAAHPKPPQRLDPLWDELFPAEQARIVQLLVERVDIGLGGLDVRLRVDGLSSLVRELAADVGKAA